MQRPPHSGMKTPWGVAQAVYPIADGVCSVSTAGHGGVKVRRDLNARIPAYMRTPGGWYEEDVEWSIPFVALEQHITATAADAHPIPVMTPEGLVNRRHPAERVLKVITDGVHVKTFRNWFPDEYEQFFGVILQPGESSVRDEQMFYAAHRNDWLVVAAMGDWKEGVPKGFVCVVAMQGGRRQGGGIHILSQPERYFLIPEDEYHVRYGSAFVVDPSRHQEVQGC